jgi:ATP-dependent protease ClpP protease subunit
MNRKRKQSSSDLSEQKRLKIQQTKQTKQTKQPESTTMEVEEGHNSVEYYIKGERLDTTDTRIVKSYNHVYFYSSITRKSAADLITTLLNIDYDNVEDMHKHGEIRPIYLHMLSEGGDIFAALAIHQNIKRLHSPVHCYVNGFLSSAAIIILLACPRRYMSNNSFLGIHSMKMSVWGKLQFLQQCNDNYKKIWSSLENMYEKNTKLKQNKINVKKFMTESQIMDCEMAFKYGFITDIIE